ncbi:hypothetical protein HPP92_028088 [Vanilla planifolia]|uniref:Uncharacterized protein n=1 Tax=Vanilla planifolia TaxID=51239 RepID=A0A835U6H8_VANPL|nr:hypothetical protein HPP92_028088 [Vanilla planifolia]
MTIATNMIEYRKSEQDIVPVLNFVSSLLLSQYGIVLRRLMMTADAISLTRMMISKDATLFRQQIGMFVADAFYRWMHEVILGNKDSSQNNGLMPEVNGKRTKILSLSSSPSPYQYNMLRDRRIKVIFYSKLSQVRKHPILMLRACWSCFTVLVMAFMIALHKFTPRCLKVFSILFLLYPSQLQ